jgi:putative transposase
MNERQAYATDLTDAEWECLLKVIPLKRTPPAKMREYVNAMLYVLRTGCSWRLLPHDFPPWSTVYDVYQKLGRNGGWARINDALREQVRVGAEREAEPSVLIADSQSVKTTEKGALVATTAASGSKGASGTSWSIRKAGSSA